ncbi:MAG: A/G-specific adenine glycosylase, partial [Blastocatellia bacterium]
MPEPLSNNFAAILVEWYDRTTARHAADMPWRDSRDPYRIWLSEIMLQQTRVAAAGDYFRRFLASWPSLESLAAAPLDDVLKCWEGLGYYARARNLHALAQTLVRDHGGQFPDNVNALLRLPGIGPYTAAAIASIAFDQRAAAVDGNVIRILARLTDLPDDVTLPATQHQLRTLAESLLPDERAGDYNQALMDLGRTVCIPRRPVCEYCPVAAYCLAYERGTQTQRPVKKAKAPLQTVR